jgi:hypothetical protein
VFARLDGLPSADAGQPSTTKAAASAAASNPAASNPAASNPAASNPTANAGARPESRRRRNPKPTASADPDAANPR